MTKPPKAPASPLLMREYPEGPILAKYEVRSAPRRLRVPKMWPYGRLAWYDELCAYDGGWMDEDPSELGYNSVWAVDVYALPLEA